MDTKQINEALAKLDRSIASLRREMKREENQDMLSKTITVKVQSWSTFERGTLIDKMLELVDDHAMKFDRKKISVMWEMYRQLRVRLGIE